MFKSLAALLESLGERKDGETLGPDEVQLATAALLFHAVAVDGTVREEEMGQLRRLLGAHFQLDEQALNRLLTEAEQRERAAIDIFRFTSVLRDRLSPEEKREIIMMMWRVVYADGELGALEDNLIWRTAELLAVSARERMELKLMVRAGHE